MISKKEAAEVLLNDLARKVAALCDEQMVEDARAILKQPVYRYLKDIEEEQDKSSRVRWAPWNRSPSFLKGI